MATKAKVELFVIHTDKDGIETRHKIKKMSGTVGDAIDWIERAITDKEYDDDLPEAGMSSGCW